MASKGPDFKMARLHHLRNFRTKMINKKFMTKLVNSIWTASSEFGTYRICEQRRFGRACASAQSRQNLQLLAHTSSESRGTFRQKARSLAPLNGWACAVKICHDGLLEDTNSFDGAHMGTAECIPAVSSVLFLV